MATVKSPVIGEVGLDRLCVKTQTCPVQCNSNGSIARACKAAETRIAATPTHPKTRIASVMSGCPAHHAAIVRAPSTVLIPHAARQRPKRVTATWTAGAARMKAPDLRFQIRLKMSVPFVPPNPKLFFTACSIFMSRAVLAQ